MTTVLAILLSVSVVTNFILTGILILKGKEHRNTKWQLMWYNRLSR